MDVHHLEQHPDEVGRYARDYWLDDSKLKRFRARGAVDLEGEAEALYKQTIASYGELETLRKATLGDLAAGELFPICRRLSVGKEAPEIMGRDVEGEVFDQSGRGRKRQLVKRQLQRAWTARWWRDGPLFAGGAEWTLRGLILTAEQVPNGNGQESVPMSDRSE